MAPPGGDAPLVDKCGCMVVSDMGEAVVGEDMVEEEDRRTDRGRCRDGGKE